MPEFSRRTLGDLALCGAVIAGSAILFIGSADLPPPRFEPMGSAAMPRILGAVLTLLAVIVGIQAFRRPDPDGAPQPLPYRGALVLGALVCFVGALDFGRVPFVAAATVFVMATGVIMSRPTLRNALIFGALGLIVALALSWVLTSFLYIRIG